MPVKTSVWSTGFKALRWDRRKRPWTWSYGSTWTWFCVSLLRPGGVCSWSSVRLWLLWWLGTLKNIKCVEMCACEDQEARRHLVGVARPDYCPLGSTPLPQGSPNWSDQLGMVTASGWWDAMRFWRLRRIIPKRLLGTHTLISLSCAWNLCVWLEGHPGTWQRNWALALHG